MSRKISLTRQQSKEIVYYFLQQLREAPDITEMLQHTQVVTAEACRSPLHTARYIWKEAQVSIAAQGQDAVSLRIMKMNWKRVHVYL
jgi:hypothetical protein